MLKIKKIIDKNIPNTKTIKAIKKAKNGKKLIVCKDVNDLFNKLGI